MTVTNVYQASVGVDPESKKNDEKNGSFSYIGQYATNCGDYSKKFKGSLLTNQCNGK